MSKHGVSWQARAVVAVLRMTGMNQRTGEQLAAKIAKRDEKFKSVTPPARMMKGLGVTRSELDGWPVWTLQPADPGKRSGRVVVGIHGGGYTHEIIFPHWSFYASLAHDAGATVIVPIYPLAPHGTAGSVVPAIADLIAAQIADFGAEQVAVTGDSAGAGLAMAAVQQLVVRRTPVPASLVLVSPWLDVTIQDARCRQTKDPMLSADSLAAAGRLWAGDLDSAHPLASPLYGSLNGFPPTMVYAGSLDLLYWDAVRLRERALAEGAPIDFDLRPGLPHGWAGFTFLPEAKSVKAQILQKLTNGRRH